jgi:hypothetical protein
MSEDGRPTWVTEAQFLESQAQMKTLITLLRECTGSLKEIGEQMGKMQLEFRRVASALTDRSA